nr:hypothetical protein [Novosphingobium sp. UBA1939]
MLGRRLLGDAGKALGRSALDLRGRGASGIAADIVETAVAGGHRDEDGHRIGTANRQPLAPRLGRAALRHHADGRGEAQRAGHAVLRRALPGKPDRVAGRGNGAPLRRGQRHVEIDPPRPVAGQFDRDHLVHRRGHDRAAVAEVLCGEPRGGERRVKVQLAPVIDQRAKAGQVQ